MTSDQEECAECTPEGLVGGVLDTVIVAINESVHSANGNSIMSEFSDLQRLFYFAQHCF